MNGRFEHGTATGFTLAAAMLLAAAPAPATAPPAPAAAAAGTCTHALAATYAVRHMEMGGGIELRDDGSFRYEMAYGALDEAAQGRWTCDDAAVFLTSDPIVPPRFAVLGTGPGLRGQLRVTLDLPKGMSRQYFDVLIRNADGSGDRRQFGEDGLTISLTPQARPVEIVPLLPVYQLAGDPIALPPEDGLTLRLRFVPNDLGQVAFSRTPLKRDARGLSLQRFGETILLQRVRGATAGE